MSDLGCGYGTVTVVDGVLYVAGTTDELETLFAFDLSGKLKWKKTYGPYYKRRYPGSRTTPTVRKGKVFVISGIGRVVCFDANSGKHIWSVDGKKQFEARSPRYGIAESPLVVDGQVIFTAGGTDAALVALDADTGKTVWRTTGLSDRSAFCSPLLVERGGRKLIVTMTGKHIVGVDADDGAVLWKHAYRNQHGDHMNTPVYHDGRLYVSSGYGEGGVMLKLSPDGKEVTLGWTDKTLDVHAGQMVLVDGHIYGAGQKGNWVCLELDSGKVAYDLGRRESPVSGGSLTWADDMLYCFSTRRGTVALVPATPDGFKPVSTFRPNWPTGRKWSSGRGCWSPPVVCGGRLYIRRDHVLMVYDIKDDKSSPRIADSESLDRKSDVGTKTRRKQP